MSSLSVVTFLFDTPWNTCRCWWWMVWSIAASAFYIKIHIGMCTFLFCVGFPSFYTPHTILRYPSILLLILILFFSTISRSSHYLVMASLQLSTFTFIIIENHVVSTPHHAFPLISPSPHALYPFTQVIMKSPEENQKRGREKLCSLLSKPSDIQRDAQKVWSRHELMSSILFMHSNPLMKQRNPITFRLEPWNTQLSFPSSPTWSSHHDWFILMSNMKTASHPFIISMAIKAIVDVVSVDHMYCDPYLLFSCLFSFRCCSWTMFHLSTLTVIVCINRIKWRQ